MTGDTMFDIGSNLGETRSNAETQKVGNFLLNFLRYFMNNRI